MMVVLLMVMRKVSPRGQRLPAQVVRHVAIGVEAKWGLVSKPRSWLAETIISANECRSLDHPRNDWTIVGICMASLISPTSDKLIQ